MTNAARLRKARRAVHKAIMTSRGLPSEDAFELVRDAAVAACAIMRMVADDLEPPE